MPIRIEYKTGDKIGNCTFVKEVDKRPTSKNRRAEFICKCGKPFVCDILWVRSGNTLSCGCHNKKVQSERNLVHGHSILTNRSKEYMIWQGMKARCLNPKHKQYKDYGGRGIKVCDRWLHSFPNFLDDMGQKPTPKHTLDRKENDGNYEPSNCKWSTYLEQQANTSRTTYVNYEGQRISLIEISKRFSINPKVVWARLYRYKWTLQDALAKPVQKKQVA